MSVKYNDNETTVTKIKTALEKNGGYCPCRVKKTEDTICMCKEFRDQIAAGISGTCHCGLYRFEAEDNKGGN